MSQIEKLQVAGIRSYGGTSVIEFFTPLTVIVGPNGAGKTTIIEALNYITTGDMPPNSKGAAFVHDPKIAGEQEVKGQVKLMFKDVTGNRVIVTRSLLSTQKLKKLECKSLENVIKRNSNGEWASLSSKCADMNREMITCLGVSKAVLDCVIFCHQEDSLWPLSEGRVLKTKFDDIFAATRYIKALEAIKKVRKELTAEVKLFKTELEHLKGTKHKADEIRDNLEETTKKLGETQSQIEEINTSIGPVQLRLETLAKGQQEFNKLERNLEVVYSEKVQLTKVNKNLKEKITDLFSGSIDELRTTYEEFETKVHEKEADLYQTEAILRVEDREHENLNSEKSSVLNRHGSLQQEAEQHKANIKERDEMIIEQSRMFQFTGFDNPPFSQETVASFVESTKEKYKKLIQEGKYSKQAYQDRIRDTQNKIDGIKKTLYQYEETIRIKNNLLVENQKKLKQVGRDLSNVDASAKKLQRIENELKTAEKELDDAKTSGNIAQWKTELDTSQKEKRRLESDLSRLRDEQQTMHLQSTTQAKLDMSRKQKDTKEEAIQQIIARHEEGLNSMFGACGPVETLKNRVAKYLQDKRVELRNTNTSLEKWKQQKSSKEAEKRMIAEEFGRLQSLVADYKNEIKKTCGDKDYATLKNDVYDAIEEAKRKCNQLSAFETIYQKYILNLEDKEKKETSCPLCHRPFNNLKEVQDLLAELKDKISRVPEKLRAQQDGLERGEEMHKRLQKLASVKDNLEDIEDKKLPMAKQKLEKISGELLELQNTIEELEDVRGVMESEESDARQIEPDLVMLEEHQKSLKSLDREISLLQAKLEGVAPGRSMQLVTNEITDCQDRVDGLNHIIERKRNQISKLESRVASLSGNVHELSSEKMRLGGELQRRTHLEEQKADLTAANMEHQREIKEAERQLQPIKANVQDLRKQHESLVVEQENDFEKTNSKLNEIRGCANKLKSKMEDIRKYVDSNRELALEEIKEKLSAVEAQLKTVQEDRTRLSSQMDRLKNDLSRRKVQSRELQDNIQVLENEEKISKLDKDLKRIRNKQEELGDLIQLRREHSALTSRLESHRKQKATCEGRQAGYREEIVRFQRDLKSPLFEDADSKHRKKLIEIKTTEIATDDLDKYYKALDRAIMKFHSIKMEEINKIIKEYWINTYKGTDIDTIEIRSDEDSSEGTAITSRRTYNYKVVMVKGSVALDMRGRCSAGQKVLASLIIRLALAETFCLNCGILALDEPTTNLDEENIESLANQLVSIIRSRNPQKNFQLLVITHDERFVELLTQADFMEHYYRVNKDEDGISRIYKQSVAGNEGI